MGMCCRVIEEAVRRGGEEELLQLMARFRQCFVDALKPRHLSTAWQVNHKCAQAWQDLCSEQFGCFDALDLSLSHIKYYLYNAVPAHGATSIVQCIYYV